MILRATIIGFIALFVSGCNTVPAQDIERAKSEGIPLLFTKVYASGPNSAGGVDTHAKFINTSNKSLKYVVFTVVPYNAVGDVAPSEIGRKTSARLKDTGPIGPGSGNGSGYWKNTWYNHSIRCIELVGVEITYMDGNTDSFIGDEIVRMMSTGTTNTCS